MKRRGNMLVEVVFLLPMLMVIIVVSSGLFPVLVQDVPHVQRAAVSRGSLDEMLRRVQRDFDQAVALPDAAGDLRAGEQRLLIELPEGIVRYDADANEIVRSEGSRQGGAWKRTDGWRTPRAVVRFERPPECPQAVAVRTSVSQLVQGRPSERLANTNLLFAGAVPGRRAAP